MMNKIYYLASCDTCRKIMKSLPNMDKLEFHDIRQNPITKEELEDSLVCCVVNFEPKQVGPFMSEVLTLGFRNTEGIGWVLIEPKKGSVESGWK